jgi:hypothetical protein
VEGPFGGARETVKSSSAEELPEPLEVVDEIEPVRGAEPAAPPPRTSVKAPEPPASPPAAPRPDAVSSSLLRELEGRLDARLEEMAAKIAQSRTDFSRVDTSCNVLASRLEVQERQASESGRAIAESRQAVEARLAAVDERAGGRQPRDRPLRRGRRPPRGP